jgi:hypothetical protein
MEKISTMKCTMRVAGLLGKGSTFIVHTRMQDDSEMEGRSLL